LLVGLAKKVLGGNQASIFPDRNVFVLYIEKKTI
jgi:hypothetical protein